MAEYRLYCLSETGQFTMAHEIVAESDEDALSQARDMRLDQRCELWNKARKIAVLDPAKG